MFQYNQCRTFAGLFLADPVCRAQKLLKLRGGVVGCDVAIAVTEKHPFLVAMVDATLHMDNFRYYVVQDALYLQEFADCLRRLSRSAGNDVDSKRLEKL